MSLFFFFFFLSTYTIILGIYFTFKRYITRTIRTVTSLSFCLDSPPLPLSAFVFRLHFIFLVFLLFPLLSIVLLKSRFQFLCFFLFFFPFFFILFCNIGDENLGREREENRGPSGVHTRMRTDALGFSFENNLCTRVKPYSVHGIKSAIYSSLEIVS